MKRFKMMMVATAGIIVGTTMSLPAFADWRVALDGAALIENGGTTRLELRCDNNANTGNRPSWRIEVHMSNLKNVGPQAEVAFRFPNRAPFRIMGENRHGAVALEGLSLPSQSDMAALVARLKAARSVSVAVTGQGGGMMTSPEMFNLTGSSRAIGAIASACRGR